MVIKNAQGKTLDIYVVVEIVERCRIFYFGDFCFAIRLNTIIFHNAYFCNTLMLIILLDFEPGESSV